MSRKVLLVDGSAPDRRFPKQLLKAHCEVLSVRGCQEALKLIKERADEIGCVLLDMTPPETEGCAMLRQLRWIEALRHLPVIAILQKENDAAVNRALAFGASDIISPPYSPEVILNRVDNAMRLYEANQRLKTITRDGLTGLYQREAFFDKAAELIGKRPSGYYMLSSIDIDKFKVINDQNGNEIGDEVLKHMADCLKRCTTALGGICCRVTADQFAALIPASMMGAKELMEYHNEAVRPPALPSPITLSVGRYLVCDLTLSPSAMYDRAMIAELSVKGRYDKHIATYNESMRDSLIREQSIVTEMKPALEHSQFEVWFQPQYNHATGALIGAEALSRWRHPVKGLISPGLFVPVFERNGFIYELDQYVWEKSCAYLRKWLDEGRSPLPVSVNLSRYDVFRDDLIPIIVSLIEKYQIPAELLRIEITESAFSSSAEQIIAVVRQLIELGFTVEIDDFGSGYSSLNTLKDVPADVLKLDMRFLENNENSQRGGNILESIVRMAKWLGMAVIAEGVETVEQADYLKTIGCNYIQGFLYARPMPPEQYEALASQIHQEERLIAMESVKTLNNNAFWNPQSMDTLIFNSYVGGACIFEYMDGAIELLRANDKYAQALGGMDDLRVDEALRLAWCDYLSHDQQQVLRDAIKRATDTGDEVSCELCFHNLPMRDGLTYMRLMLRVIATAGERYLVYCTNENITAQRLAEQKEHAAARQLKAIMENIHGGVTAAVLENDGLRILFANDEFYRQLGYTKEQYEREMPYPASPIHPMDYERVYHKITEVGQTREPFTESYRVLRRDGTVRWMSTTISIIDLAEISKPVQLAVAIDITAQVEAEKLAKRNAEQMQNLLENIGSGITAVTLDGDRSAEYLFVNDRYYSMMGYTKEQYLLEVTQPFSRIHPLDRDRVIQSVRSVNQTGQQLTLEHRAIRRDGSVIWLHAIISVTSFDWIDKPVQLSIFTDITQKKLAEERLCQADRTMRSLNKAVSHMMDEIPGGFCRIRLNEDGAPASVQLNDGFCRMLGTTKNAFMEKYHGDIKAVVHPQDVDIAITAIRQMVSGGEINNVAYRVKNGSGEYVRLIASGSSERDEQGQVYLNIYHDDAPLCAGGD